MDGEMKPFNAPDVERMDVIRVNHCIGSGVPDDPYRRADDYYSADGRFIVRCDEWAEAAAARARAALGGDGG